MEIAKTIKLLSLITTKQKKFTKGMERFNKTLDIWKQNLTWGSKYVISLNMSLLNHPSKGRVIGLEKKRKKKQDLITHCL